MSFCADKFLQVKIVGFFRTDSISQKTPKKVNPRKLDTIPLEMSKIIEIAILFKWCNDLKIIYNDWRSAFYTIENAMQ